MDQKALILDLAMNLTRIGNWIADDYRGKLGCIEIFLAQVSVQFTQLKPDTLPDPLKRPLINVKADLKRFLLSRESVSRDPLLWAENFLTWGNILTHRARLLT